MTMKTRVVVRRCQLRRTAARAERWRAVFVSLPPGRALLEKGLRNSPKHVEHHSTFIQPSNMVLTLYKLDASPPVRAVCMTMDCLGITDAEYIDVDVVQFEQLKEDYVKMNPQHTIPTLVDGDFAIWDSHAIVTYLVSVYGENDSLYPLDPKRRALIDQRLHFDSGVMFPAFREATGSIVFGGATTVAPKMIENIEKAYEFTEKFLTRPWLAGDDITVADICCVATISTLKELVAIDEDLYPRLTDWLQRCSEEEFYKKENVPGLLQYREIITTYSMR